MTSKTQRATHWCFTSYIEPSWTDIHPKLRYIIFGQELCPTTDRMHWQGYLQCKTKQSLHALKKILNDNTVHLEIKSEYSTNSQARDYCKKDKLFQEFGEFVANAGTRTDLVAITAQIMEGTSLSEIRLANPEIYCRYRNGLADIAGDSLKQTTKNMRHVEVILIHGPTGTGKTHFAFNSCSEPWYKTTGSRLKWWNGYDGEDTIIIDEYNNDIGVTELLNLLDGYQLRLEVKGSFSYAKWTKIIITTNLELYELHPQAKTAHRDALFRRITTFIRLDKKTNETNETNDTNTFGTLYTYNREEAKDYFDYTVL